MGSIWFAGRKWEVKAGGPWGPGGNLWSDAGESVWTDVRGLHLRVRRGGGGPWTCAEVSTRETVGYGEYLFFVDARLDRMDPGVVLGLFTYEGEGPELGPGGGEIDVEIATTFESPLDPALSQRLHFTAHTRPGFYSSSALALNGTHTTHRIVWKPGGIVWESWHGHHTSPPPGHLIHQARYDGPTPAPGKSRIHLNLWLLEGIDAPVHGREVEVVIRDVVYVEEPWG